MWERAEHKRSTRSCHHDDAHDHPTQRPARHRHASYAPCPPVSIAQFGSPACDAWLAAAYCG
jgi:hypothetical protein